MSASPTPTDPRRRAYLPQLDGFRGYGMLIVLLAHLPRPSDSVAAALIWQAEHVSKVGDIALDAFFIMSGFLITRLLLAERLRSGRISLRQFYLRRVLRIFPVYYLTVRVVTLCWPTTLDRTASLIFYAYNVYLPFHPSPYPLEQSWSLAVEEQFYLLWPLLVIVLPPRWLGRTTLVVLPLAAIATAVGFAACTLPALGAELIYTMLPTRMLPIALGFVVTMINPGTPGWILAPFRLATARFLGQISYAVYLVHIPLLFAFGVNDAALSGGPAPVRWSLLIIALSLGLACLSWLLIERPLARLKSRLGPPGEGCGGGLALSTRALSLGAAGPWIAGSSPAKTTLGRGRHSNRTAVGQARG